MMRMADFSGVLLWHNGLRIWCVVAAVAWVAGVARFQSLAQELPHAPGMAKKIKKKRKEKKKKKKKKRKKRSIPRGREPSSLGFEDRRVCQVGWRMRVGS